MTISIILEHIRVDAIKKVGGFDQCFAVFGYLNRDSVDVNIPIGPDNRFAQPGPENRGQPTVFKPGRHIDVFEIPIFSGETFVWTLRSPDDGSRRTAAASFPILGDLNHRVTDRVSVVFGIDSIVPTYVNPNKFNLKIPRNNRLNTMFVDVLDGINPIPVPREIFGPGPTRLLEGQHTISSKAEFSWTLLDIILTSLPRF